MSSVVWTDDLRKCLIDAYHSRPPLWNHFDACYKNSALTTDLRNEVAAILSAKACVQISGDEVAKQWKSLKDQYLRFLGKVNRFSVGLERKLPKFKFSRRLQFFMPPRAAMFSQLANANWEVENPPLLSPREIKNEINGEVTEPIEIAITSPSSSSQKRKNTEQELERSERALEITANGDVVQRTTERERDVYDSLGETLADSLRTTYECSPLEGIEYKCEILELITKYERKKLRL
uniref:MADF domain-containing protein n=1 Tax=Ascaris lumbricoides TaxID=6252 RepID=A0A0M3IEI9_ASCLU